MIRYLFSVILVCSVCQTGWAQNPKLDGKSEPASVETAVRERLKSYIDTFNKHDADELGKFWVEDGISVADATGQRTTGREDIKKEFLEIFEKHPSIRLAGEVEEIRLVRPEVAIVEGRTTLFIEDMDPVLSAFTTVLVKEDNEWLLSSSHERDLPTPISPYEALKELEWLVGTWEDEIEGPKVLTIVRWSPNRAFLVRTFAVEIEEEGLLQGTQIIGWDPINKQIRAWNFNSDGTFGQGTVARHDNEWTLKMWHVLSDGRVGAATRVLSRVDEDTMTVQTIGETVNGEPVPTSPPVVVKRVAVDAALSEGDSGESTKGTAP